MAEPTVEELKAILDEKGVDYGRKNSVNALQKLLEVDADG